MANRKVSIERHVEQVINGRHYKGHLKISGIQLNYEIVFGVAIANLDDMEPPENVDEIRRNFHLTVKRGDVNIDLTNEEYGFFIQMIMEVAIDFYNNPQTRDNNEGLVGILLKGRGSLASFGVTASIGMTSHATYNFTPKLCEMLSAPKFGCALVTV